MRRRRGLSLKRAWPSARRRRRWWRTFRRSPGGVQAGLALALILGVLLAVNWVYQVALKPTELLFPVSGVLYKSPAETWIDYGPLFERYSTRIMTPELLAALAQVEGSGNPIVRTYWRWSFGPRPFEVYRPASSAVGMYQLTNGTFAEAKRYCIRDHRVIEDGAWDDWHSCWLNGLYLRILPRDAIEMTSAYLDRTVTATLLARHVRRATLQQEQKLAAVIHLCGAGAGDLYVRRHFRLAEGQRCGDEDVQGYLRRVNTMRRRFAWLAASPAARDAAIPGR